MTRILTLAVAAILASAAQAQGSPAPQLETVTVFGHRVDSTLSTQSSTGSRLGMSVLETPASVEAIAGELIRQRGDSTVVEAVTRATGLSNDASPGDGGSSMSARGFVGHNSIMQLYDGTRLFIGAGTVTFPFDTWMAERIEVLRGPASVMYGQGAIGGVINVVPRKPSLEGREGEMLVGGGGDGRINAQLDFNAPVSEQLAYRVDASYRESVNWVERGDSESLAVSGSVLWAPSDDFRLTLSSDYSDVMAMQYWGTPLRNGRIDESLRELNYNVKDSDISYADASTRLRAEWQVSPNLTVTNTAYYLDTDRHWRNLEEYYLDDATETIERQFYVEIWHRQEQVGNQVDAKFQHRIAGRENTTVVGFDVNQVEFEHINNSPYEGSSVVPVRGFDPGLFLNWAGTFPKYSTDTEQYSFFFENRFELNDQWSVIAGARYDSNDYERTNLLDGSQFAGTFSDTTWRAGVVYQPAQDLSFYAQYATAVDPIGSLASLTAAQADLELTTGKQTEVGIKQSLFDARLEWTLGAYRIVKKDLQTRVPGSANPNALQQVGQQSSRGVEASLAWTIKDSLRIDANVAALNAQYDDFVDRAGGVLVSRVGKTPPSVPERVANVWASWQFVSDWRARAGVRYVGKRYLDNANSTELPSYSVIDAAIDWAVSHELTIGAHVRNAADKSYALSSYGPQFILGMPRTWEVQARYRF